MLSVVAYSLYHGVGERLPAMILMRASYVLTHCQRSVEQEHALLCPATQTAVIHPFAVLHAYRRQFRHCADIGFHLFENVYQRRRQFYSVLDREAQTLCLPCSMVRVLSEYDYLYLVYRA